MSAYSNRVKHAMFVALVRDFAADAREHARAVATGSSEWQFYRGVQAAASDVLQADIGHVRTNHTAWLSGEDPGFRDGYHTASTMLASAALAPERRRRIVVPVLQRTTT